MSLPLREASSVILLRRTPSASGFQVLLLRRRKGASFMASAFVFPGGAAEPGEGAKAAAARELFEEAGILLACGGDPDPATRAALRKRILDGGDADAALADHSLAWSTEPLVPWSHWITPSIEPKRFSARFFVSELPAGQQPEFDAIETVDQVWETPEGAIARAKELALPPPQIRTCWELAEYDTVEAVLAAARRRAAEPHPIIPRLRTNDSAGAPCLLLPWDPEYDVRGTGDSSPLAFRPSWARGPSRFVMEDQTWKHVLAPGSTTAGS